MLRASSFVYEPSKSQSTILSCLTYSTQKLWNVANFERRNWDKESGEKYPNWYEQKKNLKAHFWYKNLPSQSAQELLKVLEQSWVSFYQLVKLQPQKNPKPPRFKHKNFNIKFLSGGFKIIEGKLRLTLSSQMRDYLKEKCDISDRFLFLKLPSHIKIHHVKTVEMIPIENDNFQVVLVQDVPKSSDKELTRTEKYMSIDIGIRNAMTCYTYKGSSHIISGRQWLSVERYYHKMIAHYSSISDAQQAKCDIQYPKQSKRVAQLYQKKRKQVHHLLHCMTKRIVDIALSEGVETIVIGNITNIRKNANFGRVTNQKLHALPFKKIIQMITYKAEEKGIFVDSTSITEEYTSQTCAVCKEEPSKSNAKKSNRKHRGLYVCCDCHAVINADVNGAVNIGKKYLKSHLKNNVKSVVVLDTPVRYIFNGQRFA